MALKFFWRCEGTTVTGPDDYGNGGSLTAVSNSAVALNSTAARVGTNGLYANTASDHYRFSSISGLVPASTGAFALSFRINTFVNGSQFLSSRNSSITSNYYTLSMVGVDDATGREIRITARNPADGTYSFTTTGADLQLNTWYGLVARYEQSTSTLRIEIYNADGSLRVGEQGTVAYTAPTGMDELILGEVGGEAASTYLDNIFVADTFNEDLEDFLTITSYTEYGVKGDAPSLLNGPFGGLFQKLV